MISFFAYRKQFLCLQFYSYLVFGFSSTPMTMNQFTFMCNIKGICKNPIGPRNRCD